MRYRTLGRTGLKVSEIGIGGAQIGLKNYMGIWDPATQQSVDQIVDLVHYSQELGYNYIDTAPGYGNRRSEEIVGLALKDRRSDWVLASKCAWDVSAAEVTASVELSLQVMQTDYIDVMQFHGGDFRYEDVKHILEDGVLDSLLRLKEQGKIRYVGITAEEPVTLRPLLKTGLFDVVQMRFNVMYQNAYHNMLSEAQEVGAGVVIMRPATSGLLAKLFQASYPESSGKILAQCNLAELSLNFVLSAPQVTVAIVGMRTRAEAEANARLSDDISRRLDQDWLHDRFVYPDQQ